jgi:two-component system response regulator YesN
MKIVIVEDEIRIREGVTRLLRKISPDYEIVGEAENGETGLALIEETHPDLIITDIKMPKMDGLEMLSILHEHKYHAMVIVLSAYSEFTYAQQAIKLGISEYLLKPIALESFSKSIRNIEAQIAHDRLLLTENPQQLRSLDNILYGILYSSLPIDNELKEFLRTTYGMDSEGSYGLIDMYLGAAYAEKKDRLLSLVKRLLHDTDYIYHLLALPQSKDFLILISMAHRQEIERHFRDVLTPQVRQAAGDSVVFGWIIFNGLARMKESVGTIRRYLDWNIVKEHEIITYPEVAHIQPASLSYPIEMEKQAKTIVCTFSYGELNDVFCLFMNHLRGNTYSPAEIKETVVRFLWAIITILKEIDYEAYGRIEQQALLERIMSAVTWTELTEAINLLPEILSVREKEQHLSLQVRRAKSIIYECYQKGITLDEIAEQLGITPEYLSTQFHKEVGLTFNTFIKNHRMKKAKELLIGTDKKLYEIAAAVGYTDPKYFSRVFREATGQLPAQFRKVHK